MAEMVSTAPTSLVVRLLTARRERRRGCESIVVVFCGFHAVGGWRASCEKAKLAALRPGSDYGPGVSAKRQRVNIT